MAGSYMITLGIAFFVSGIALLLGFKYFVRYLIFLNELGISAIVGKKNVKKYKPDAFKWLYTAGIIFVALVLIYAGLILLGLL